MPMIVKKYPLGPPAVPGRFDDLLAFEHRQYRAFQLFPDSGQLTGILGILIASNIINFCLLPEMEGY